MRLAAAVTAATIAAFTATTAAANPPDPRDPCADGRNPTTLCGDGDITVTVEPAGDNCEFGGLKIVVVNGRPDGQPEPTPLEPLTVTDHPTPPDPPGRNASTSATAPPAPPVTTAPPAPSAPSDPPGRSAPSGRSDQSAPPGRTGCPARPAPAPRRVSTGAACRR